MKTISPQPCSRSTLSEVSDAFPVAPITRLFHDELERVAPKALTADSKDSITRLKKIGIVPYIDRTLRRLGFRDPDLDAAVQHVLVKILMGSFFTGWDGSVPLDARFKLSVANAARTLADREKRYRRSGSHLPPVLADPRSGEDASGSETIQAFRRYVQQHVGDAGLKLLDHRMNGGESKDLVGSLGLETSYRLKLTVGHLKSAAREFAAADPDLARMVERAFEADQGVITKRRATTISRSNR